MRSCCQVSFPFLYLSLSPSITIGIYDLACTPSFSISVTTTATILKGKVDSINQCIPSSTSISSERSQSTLTLVLTLSYRFMFDLARISFIHYLLLSTAALYLVFCENCSPDLHNSYMIFFFSVTLFMRLQGLHSIDCSFFLA